MVKGLALIALALTIAPQTRVELGVAKKVHSTKGKKDIYCQGKYLEHGGRQWGSNPLEERFSTLDNALRGRFVKSPTQTLVG